MAQRSLHPPRGCRRRGGLIVRSTDGATAANRVSCADHKQCGSFRILCRLEGAQRGWLWLGGTQARAVDAVTVRYVQYSIKRNPCHVTCE